MLSVWRSVLGDENVVDFSYEEAMAQLDSTIPAVLSALSIDATGLPSWEGVTANTASRATSVGERLPFHLKTRVGHGQASSFVSPPSCSLRTDRRAPERSGISFGASLPD